LEAIRTRKSFQIPSHTPSDLYDFISLCLQQEPVARPRATELLQHAFLDKVRARPTVANYASAFSNAESETQMTGARERLSTLRGSIVYPSEFTPSVDELHAQKQAQKTEVACIIDAVRSYYVRLWQARANSDEKLEALVW
jgi:hypothetical protein